MSGRPLHAIVLVLHDDDLTLYVKRSGAMEKYPGAWSLPSMQYDPDAFEDPNDLARAQELATALSDERLGGAALRIKRLVTEGSSDDNPMGVDVTLRLYEMEMRSEPVLDDRYYVGSAWMSPERCREKSTGGPSGLCVRLWADHSPQHGPVR